MTNVNFLIFGVMLLFGMFTRCYWRPRSAGIRLVSQAERGRTCSEEANTKRLRSGGNPVSAKDKQ